jgi:hypothetical protein
VHRAPGAEIQHRDHAHAVTAELIRT